jgi:hypothetical protein
LQYKEEREESTLIKHPEAWRIDDPENFRVLIYQRTRGLGELAMEAFDPFGSWYHCVIRRRQTGSP